MEAASTSHSGGGWNFWMGWALAFVGFPLAGIAAAALIGPITTPLAGALGGTMGALLGAMQWLALRRRLLLSPWWIAATALRQYMVLSEWRFPGHCLSTEFIAKGRQQPVPCGPDGPAACG